MRLVAPTHPEQHWLASDSKGAIEVRFVGRGPSRDRSAVLATLGEVELELAWARQVHSDRALDAAPGDCGEGDALITGRAGLVLSITTADCVPVVLAAGERLAVIHAGWRGIASAIVTKALDELGAPEQTMAWLGPAIGPCCYEVGPEVAERVVRASGAAARVERPNAKPRLDLHASITCQLRERGVHEIRKVATCTRCHPEALASYRRDGEHAGRNLTFAWRTSRSSHPAPTART